MILPAAQPVLYLASQSPRRRALLEQIGVAHRRLRVEVAEQLRAGETPEDLVRRLAVAKANAGWRLCADQGYDRLPVLGADTAVVVGARVLGKPAGEADARAMLAELSGCAHRVFSGVALRVDERVETALSVTRVRFRALGEAEIDAYWATGEGADKAGGYAIQGLAAQFIEHIDGSYSGVMGLPLFETAGLLAACANDTGRRMR